MLCFAMDASISVTIYVPFGSIYHNQKWTGACKKWQMWRPDGFKQCQLDILGSG